MNIAYRVGVSMQPNYVIKWICVGGFKLQSHKRKFTNSTKTKRVKQGTAGCEQQIT